MEIILQQLDTFTTITNVWIKDYLLFEVTPSTNIPSRNNKVKLRGWCATDYIEPATLIRTIFLALKYIYKRNDIKVLIKNINLKNRCHREFSEWNKIC